MKKQAKCDYHVLRSAPGVVLVAGSLLLAVFGATERKLEGQRNAAALTSLAASFDWSMPDRLRVDDTNTIVPVEDPNPATWKVNFDACDSSGDIKEYRWTFGDGQQAVTTRCDGLSPHTFPREGVFRVSLTVASANGSTATTTRDVTVQDFLIIGLGDSYGSGEGSPNVEIPQRFLQRWVELGVRLVQEERKRTQASHILGAIDRLLGPVEDLLTAITLRDVVNCSVCTPDGIREAGCFAACLICGFPAVCFVCKDECRNAAGRVADATENLAEALVEAAKTEGLEALQERIDDPTGLKGALESLKTTWEVIHDAAEAAIMAFQGELDDILVCVFHPVLCPLLLIPDQAKVKWNDKQCHRSSFSAQAQAALALEAADPKTLVTFIHLACSGAKSPHLYRDRYEGVDPDAGTPLLPQLTAAAQLVGDREVDAVLLSIGGNDANFAPIIFAGIFQEPTHEPLSPFFTKLAVTPLEIVPVCTLAFFFINECLDYFDTITEFGLGPPGLQLFEEGVARLPQAYRILNDNLQSTFPDVKRDPRRIFITEYPDATEDEEGKVCGPRLERLPDILNLVGWSTPEWTWAGETVIPGINGVMQVAAAEHSWTLVDGIFAGFARHGLCSDQNWINRLQQSLTHQGDPDGSVHPNRLGYAEISSHVLEALSTQLYSGSGQTARPRPPFGESIGDLDHDDDIDRDDLNILLQDLGESVSQSACGARCDLNGDGQISNLDAHELIQLCSRPQCATQ